MNMNKHKNKIAYTNEFANEMDRNIISLECTYYLKTELQRKLHNMTEVCVILRQISMTYSMNLNDPFKNSDMLIKSSGPSFEIMLTTRMQQISRSLVSRNRSYTSFALRYVSNPVAACDWNLY